MLWVFSIIGSTAPSTFVGFVVTSAGNSYKDFPFICFASMIFQRLPSRTIAHRAWFRFVFPTDFNVKINVVYCLKTINTKQIGNNRWIGPVFFSAQNPCSCVTKEPRKMYLFRIKFRSYLAAVTLEPSLSLTISSRIFPNKILRSLLHWPTLCPSDFSLLSFRLHLLDYPIVISALNTYPNHLDLFTLFFPTMSVFSLTPPSTRGIQKITEFLK